MRWENPAERPETAGNSALFAADAVTSVTPLVLRLRPGAHRSTVPLPPGRSRSDPAPTRRPARWGPSGQTGQLSA
jgi:hypothetical protein